MEKRVGAFVLSAFVLGLATKRYRDAHPSPAPSPMNKGHYGETSRADPTSLVTLSDTDRLRIANLDPATGAVTLQCRILLRAEIP